MKETRREMKKVRARRKVIVAEWLTAKFLHYLTVASGIGLVVIGCSVAEPLGISIESFSTLFVILFPVMILSNVISHYLTYHLWKKGLISRRKVVRLIHRRYNLNGLIF